MVQLNDKKLLWSLLGAVLILVGTLIKNGYHSLKLPAINFGYKSGPLFKALGWIVTALAIATTSNSSSIFNLQMNRHGVLAIFAIGLLYWCGTEINKYQTCDTTPDSKCPQHLVAGYAGGWAMLTLALISQSNFKWSNSFLAVAAMIMILYSKFTMLPMQRRKGMVDGPGYSMVTAAWLFLAVSNSLK